MILPLKKKISKNYFFKSCYENKKYILRRCDQINKISQKLSFIPKISFRFKKNKIIKIQDFIISEKVPHKERKILLKKFAINLDKLKMLNFVHGDINYKNIVFTKKKIYLIDLEPILIKKEKNKILFRATFPYYSTEDIKKRKMTFKSDLIGFFFLCKRIFTKKINIFKFSKLKDDKWLENFTKKKNKIFFQSSFLDIYNTVRLKYDKIK